MDAVYIFDKYGKHVDENFWKRIAPSLDWVRLSTHTSIDVCRYVTTGTGQITVFGKCVEALIISCTLNCYAG